MRYRFKLPYRQYAAGDPVPDTLGAGIIATMLQMRRIEPVDVDEAEAMKTVDSLPANKALKTGKLRRKAAV